MIFQLLAIAALVCAILAFFPVRYVLNIAVLLLAILAAAPVLRGLL